MQQGEEPRTNALQLTPTHITTRCNTLQHTAAHCNTPEDPMQQFEEPRANARVWQPLVCVRLLHSMLPC